MSIDALTLFTPFKSFTPLGTSPLIHCHHHNSYSRVRLGVPGNLFLPCEGLGSLPFGSFAELHIIKGFHLSLRAREHGQDAHANRLHRQRRAPF